MTPIAVSRLDQRQEVRIGVRNRQPQDEVCGEVEAEKEDPVRERRALDDVLAGDVDAREAEARDDGDDGERCQLAVAVASRDHVLGDRR